MVDELLHRFLFARDVHRLPKTRRQFKRIHFFGIESFEVLSDFVD